MIDEFQNNRKIFVFLLSTRAGGIGVNLTAAVIFSFQQFNLLIRIKLFFTIAIGIQQ
jgi:hypothetical protein